MQIQGHTLTKYLTTRTPQCTLLYGNNAHLIEHNRIELQEHLFQKGIKQKEIILFEQKDKALSQLKQSIDSPSLFQEPTTLVCFINTSLSKDERTELSRIIHHLPTSHYLILLNEKVPKPQQKEDWFQAISKTGITVSHWPLQLKQYQEWLQNQATRLEVSCTPKALQALAQYTEGHILAGYQLLQQCALLPSDEQPFDEHKILGITSHQYKYELADLYIAVLQAEPTRIIKIVDYFKQTNHPIPLILWGLHQLVQDFLNHSQANSGLTQASVLPKSPAFLRLIQVKYSQISVSQCMQWIKNLEHIDRTFKSHNINETWPAILSFCLGLFAVT